MGLLGLAPAFDFPLKPQLWLRTACGQLATALPEQTLSHCILLHAFFGQPHRQPPCLDEVRMQQSPVEDIGQQIAPSVLTGMVAAGATATALGRTH